MGHSIFKKGFNFTYIFLLFSGLANSQSFIPGQSYFSLDGNIEYIAGDLPIIMSVPHGGYLTPSALKDRNCSGCVYIRDLSTQEMARDISDAVYNKTGCRIHVIINLLSRRKLDANREIIEAADGDPLAEVSWYAYQSFIDTARQELIRVFGKGFFIDLHGHGHILQRAELGYHLKGSDLRQSDAFLNSASTINISTIRNLVGTNPGAYNHSELIRGPFSFGEILTRAGYDAVPSKSDPAPLASQSFFSGGYTVQQQGSANGGSIDAIQIECASNTRSPSTVRKVFADSLAAVYISYLKRHYFPSPGSGVCSQTSAFHASEEVPKLRYLGSGNYSLSGLDRSYRFEVVNSLSQKVVYGSIDKLNNRISLLGMDGGIYYLILFNPSKSHTIKLIKVTSYY